MRKSILLLFFLSCLYLPVWRANSFRAGPASFEISVPMDGNSSIVVHLSPDGLVGVASLQKEDMPFKIEPEEVNILENDTVYFNLTIYGNSSYLLVLKRTMMNLDSLLM